MISALRRALLHEQNLNEQLRERVSYRQWENYAKRLEKQNLKQRGRSLSFSSIASSARSFVIEIMDDYEIIIAKPGWREAMTAAAEIKP